MYSLRDSFILLLGALSLNRRTCFVETVTTTAAVMETPLCDQICSCLSKRNQAAYIFCDLTDLKQISNATLWRDPLNSNSGSFYPVSELNVRLVNHALDAKFATSSVRYLNLNSNQLVRLPAGVFSELQDMEVLDLSFNRFKKIDPEAFKGTYSKDDYYPLRSLRKLDLSNNLLRSLDGDVFEHIENLDVLILRGNPLGVIGVRTTAAICGLAFLKVLDLGATQISALPSSFPGCTRVLADLDLAENKFTQIPTTLTDSSTLEKLVLDHNPLGDLLLDFPKIDSLRVLSVSSLADLQQVGKEAFKNLQNLEELHLRRNKKLFYVDPRALITTRDGQEEYIKLKKLDMSYNDLEFIDKDLLLHYSEMEVIDLRGNPIDCSCRNRWLVDDFVPDRIQRQDNITLEMQCHAPSKLFGRTLKELYISGVKMGCEEIWSLNLSTLLLLVFGCPLLLTVVALFADYFRKNRYKRLREESVEVYAL